MEAQALDDQENISSNRTKINVKAKLFTAGEYLPLDIWNSGSGQFSISSLIGDSFSIEFVEPVKKKGLRNSFYRFVCFMKVWSNKGKSKVQIV